MTLPAARALLALVLTWVTPHAIEASPTPAPPVTSITAAAGTAPGEQPVPLSAEVAPQDPALCDAEMALFSLVNADRQAGGLLPLVWDDYLLDIARTRASDQLPLPSLSHLDASGGMALGPLLGQTDLSYELAGENLARLPGPSFTAPARAEVALMNSPSHRHAILQPRYDHLAVGAAVGSDGRIVFAQIFRASGTAASAVSVSGA